MKALRNLIATTTTGLLLTALALSFNACTEQSPFQSANNEGVSVSPLAKNNKKKDGGGGGEESEYNYPLSTELTFLRNSKGSFQGGQLKVENGTTFYVLSGLRYTHVEFEGTKDPGRQIRSAVPLPR